MQSRLWDDRSLGQSICKRPDVSRETRDHDAEAHHSWKIGSISNFVSNLEIESSLPPLL